jgi:hypothetical protein
MILQQQQLIRDHEAIFERLDRLTDERGQRLARIEAKLDIIAAQKGDR